MTVLLPIQTFVYVWCNKVNKIIFMDKQWLAKLFFHSHKFRFHTCSILDAKIEDFFFQTFSKTTVFFPDLRLSKSNWKKPQHWNAGIKLFPWHSTAQAHITPGNVDIVDNMKLLILWFNVLAWGTTHPQRHGKLLSPPFIPTWVTHQRWQG